MRILQISAIKMTKSADFYKAQKADDHSSAENYAKMVEDYKSADKGRKPRVLKGIVGQVMKISKGKANPEIVNELIMSKLN